MNGVRADIAALLADGLPVDRISRELRVRKATVRKARTILGIAPHPPYPVAAGTPEDTFWRRAEWTDDGEHLVWPSRAVTPACLKHNGDRYSVHTIAFRIATGRDPVGRAKTGCDRPGCIRPQHVEDQAMRDQFAQIFGDAV